VYISASSRCFAEQPFFEACSSIADLEFDKVELWLDEAGTHLSPREVAEDPDGFAKRFRESSRLTPVAMFLGCDTSPEVLTGLMQAAKPLRITQITVPSSPVGTPFNTEVDRLRAFADISRYEGVRISIKTETGHLTQDPHTAVELCQAVSGLGITLDPSHYICGPHASEPIDQIFPYVYHVHLRDTAPNELQVPVGRGEMDYNRLISQLQRENYRLALSVDMDASKMDAETRALEMRKLRMLLDSLL